MKLSRSLSRKTSRSFVDMFKKHFTVSVDAVRCSISGTGSYIKGSTVYLSVTPDEHYHFSHWSDGIADPVRSITVDNDVHLTAFCVLDNFKVTFPSAVSVTRQGVPVISGSYVPYGSVLNFKVTPPPHLFVTKYEWSSAVIEDIDVQLQVFSAVKLEADSPFSVSALGDVEHSSDGVLWYPLTEPLSTKSVYLQGSAIKLYVTGTPVKVSGRLSSLTTHPARFFENCSIIDASGLILMPVSEPYQYQAFFKDCALLTKLPKMPYHISEGCFKSMFEGCTSLTAIPEFYDITLAPQCYAYMFARCSSLKSDVYLPSHALAPRCYESMFAATNVSAHFPGSIYEYYPDFPPSVK